MIAIPRSRLPPLMRYLEAHGIEVKGQLQEAGDSITCQASGASVSLFVQPAPSHTINPVGSDWVVVVASTPRYRSCSLRAHDRQVLQAVMDYLKMFQCSK